ncbi:MAG: glycosyltransferase family 2 protein [Parvularculaceae bacterium]
MMQPTVSVLIVNYNSGDRLGRCLVHLERQSFAEFEIIVVDNGSTDGSERAAENAGRETGLIRAGENLGFAAANNLAVRSASGEWLAFLNPDAYPAADWLEAFSNAVESYPGVDAFGSTQLMADDPSIIDGAGDAYHVFGVPYRGHYGWPTETLPEDGECFAPCAAAAFYRRRTFESLGGFDESFFCYGEDVDLGFRLRLAGGRAVQLSRAQVLHEGSAISGRHSDFTLYHGHRNRIWTYFLNMPLTILIPTAPFHLFANLYLLGRFMAVGGASAYLRALKDGYGGLPRLYARRRRRQHARKASLGAIARMLTWSPLKPYRREADLFPIDPQ